jgi:hypothetical protein
MKKTNRLLGGSILLAASLLFTSCQKGIDQVPVNTAAEISNLAVITKINSWLEKKKVDADDDGDMKIEALKANLDFSTLHLEKYKQNDRLVIVLLKNGFKSANNEDKNPVNYLVAILPEKEDITKGNIIQYLSATSKKQVPHNTFSKIFNFEDHDCNGQFTVLSVTDDFRYELKFENNKLKSVAERRSKTESEELKTNNCIDWYLVTTYYYADGSSESTWHYISTTCNCEQTKIAISSHSYRLNCSGGGGDGVIEYEEEYIRIAECKKVIYHFTLADGGGYCTTDQILYAKFHKIHTEKDRITACYFVTSDVINNSLGATPGISSYIAVSASNKVVNVSILGTMKYPDNINFQFSNITTINMDDLYWHN